ncbi:MAG: 50S ribosomal protein L24 [Candidatus Nanoarchaeia archaeon]
MKSTFSMNWLKSIQPRKQRKFAFNAPDHIRGQFMNALLSSTLRAKHEMRSARVRKGDKVKVLRGQFKGTTGVVETIDVSRSRLFVKGCNLVKTDGSKVPYPIHPSKVEITTLVEDKKRFKQKKSTSSDSKNEVKK